MLLDLFTSTSSISPSREFNVSISRWGQLASPGHKKIKIILAPKSNLFGGSLLYCNNGCHGIHWSDSAIDKFRHRSLQHEAPDIENERGASWVNREEPALSAQIWRAQVQSLKFLWFSQYIFTVLVIFLVVNIALIHTITWKINPFEQI